MAQLVSTHTAPDFSAEVVLTLVAAPAWTSGTSTPTPTLPASGWQYPTGRG